MDTTETKIFLTILIAAIVLVLFVVTFTITVVRHQRKIALLQYQKIHAEVLALEKDRTRIAADLHDELGPLLSSVRMRLSNTETATDDDKKGLEKAGEHLDSAVSRIREISKDLMPPVLLRKGFIVAVKDFLEQLKQDSSPEILYAIDVHEKEIPPESGVHLYRILQEIIHNSLKHADAKRIDVKIFAIHNQLHIDIGDNGKGFDKASASRHSAGIGLRNIVTRVDLLKGDLFLETDRGTRYKIVIPMATLPV